MKLGILIGLAFVLMILSWLYLAREDMVGEKLSDKLKVAVSKNKKLLIYNICAFVMLSGMAVGLVMLYADNTLIANMKLITLVSILVTVAVTDIRAQIIPNKIILVGIAVRVAYAVAELVTLGSNYFAILKLDLYAVALVAIFFIIGVLIVKNGIGMGDIKLFLVMGIFQGIYGVISSLFFSLCISFVVAIVLLITKKKTRKDSIEFAPSVLIGTVLSIFMTGM